MIFCYKFNFQRIKCKSLLSKIEQVEMLIALGRGDKYRLTHIRETIESGKELYISDKELSRKLGQGSPERQNLSSKNRVYIREI